MLLDNTRPHCEALNDQAVLCKENHTIALFVWCPPVDSP
jgi:hypothetical protein